jgi:hypothetical protein
MEIKKKILLAADKLRGSVIPIQRIRCHVRIVAAQNLKNKQLN